MLSTFAFLLAQASNEKPPESALGSNGVMSHSSRNLGPSYDRKLIRVSCTLQELQEPAAAVNLTKNWTMYKPVLTRIPRSGVPIAENAVVATNSISAAFPSIIATVRVTTVRKKPRYPFPPLPENVEEIAEAAIREGYARFIGSRLISATSVSFGGKNLIRKRYPMTATSYVPLRTFAQAVGATINENDETLRFTLNRGSRVFQFAWGTPYAKMGGGWEKLPDGVALRDGQLWIPVAAAQRFVNSAN